MSGPTVTLTGDDGHVTYHGEPHPFVEARLPSVVLRWRGGHVVDAAAHLRRIADQIDQAQR